MTTPSGTITLDNVQTEFGGTNPIGINEYYAGGIYVSAFVSGVPTSSTIDMNSLRNKTKISISNDKSSVNEAIVLLLLLLLLQLLMVLFFIGRQLVVQEQRLLMQWETVH